MYLEEEGLTALNEITLDANAYKIIQEAAATVPSEKRTPKRIPKEIENELIDIKEEDITYSYIMNLFGSFAGKEPINPYDIMTIPPGKYGKSKKNKNSFTTTVGLWIFNKYFIEEDLFHIFGYVNKTITKKVYESMNNQLAYALLEDEITVDVLKRYLLKGEKFMPFVVILAPNHSEKILTCSRVISEYKNKLIKENKEAIEAGDVVVMDKVDKQILKFATEYMGDDPSMDAFLSGARGKLGNNFKNIYCTKGVVRDPDPYAKQTYQFASSNYIDGIKAEEYALYCKSLSGGPYSRSVKTQNGGYWEKLFVAAFQHLKLGPKDSDCGTKRYITVTFNTEKDIQDYMYSYIITSSGLEELTSKNKNKYLGKTVKLRFASMCEYKPHGNTSCFCNKCAGNFLYRMNNGNIEPGLAAVQIPSKLKLVAMKAFHDSTIDLSEMDPMKAFSLK